MSTSSKRARALPLTNPSSNNEVLPSAAKADNLQELVAPHVKSFDYMIEQGLAASVKEILPQEVATDKGPDSTLRFWYESVEIGYPMKPSSSDDFDARMFPAECRERSLNYAAPLNAVICTAVGDRVDRVQRCLGMVPIMVRSKRCHLANADAKELVRRHEDATELGGYFVCNGNERVIRLLQIPHRNHIMSVERSSFKKRGAEYSSKAVSIRCVGPDQTGASVTLHYLVDGTARVRMTVKKAEYFIPVMVLLKALKTDKNTKAGYPAMATDKEIYTQVLRGANQSGNTFIPDRVELALRQVTNLKLYSAQQCRAYLGAQFRAVLPDVPADATDEEAGTRLIQRHVFVHLAQDDMDAKFDLLIEMLRKLYSFCSGETATDNSDALQNQELLLGGHLYGMILKERLEQLLIGVRMSMERDLDQLPTARTLILNDQNYFKKILMRQGDIGRKLFYFLATGNLVSESGLDLMQTSGYTIVAEKLNRYRYLSHFRSVHRGQFFTEMKTTAVRKLLPESWGFLCPVHTPDGSPCGLLNHMAALSAPVTHPLPDTCPATQYGLAAANVVATDAKSDSVAPLTLTGLLAKWGMLACGSSGHGIVPPHSYLPVLLDGRVIGHAPAEVLATIAAHLRDEKVKSMGQFARLEGLDKEQIFSYQRKNFTSNPGIFKTSSVVQDRTDTCEHTVPATLEVCFIAPGFKGGAYPGLFLFTGPARMLRPVLQVKTGLVELIGPMEQAFMEIAVRLEELREGIDTHVELSPTSMLSLIASLTPFSDFNQSPRNMYQCQMGKQTMGTPAHNLIHRPDTKMYRIQTPQAPVVQCKSQSNYIMDEYPNGTNAVVAVISYTGYDMEDAMILNKGAYERGFGHATVYKTKLIDLTDTPGSSKKVSDEHFGNVYPESSGRTGLVAKSLGADGFPEVGQRMKEGDPICAIVNPVTGKTRMEKHKDAEPCVVDRIRLIGMDGSKAGVQKASITFRYNRNPVVGDKFSSRHGQKGVMSVTWPQEDMPFTESGMTPDVIINPHAFPSRMTIGMLIESMAGKAGAIHGMYQDSTPFQMQGDEEGETAVDYFGDQLKAAGYNYYGSEPLYSGMQGTIMQADIYIGVVYYQRLRHMVSDKSQVRSLGPIDSLTKQPIKGRKRHGGVRFGEMERDSLLAHGTAFLMQDRLLNCSDRHTAYVCCGSLLSTYNMKADAASDQSSIQVSISGEGGAATSSAMVRQSTKICCKLCGSSDRWQAITIPFVFRYLVNELAAMGIKLHVE